MNLSAQIAKHFREIHVGGNWTWSNYKDQLTDVTWEQALRQVHSFNTIAILTFHHGYFVNAILKVFKGEPLNSHDKDSFAHPPINSEEDWRSMVDQLLNNADELAGLIETTPAEKWEEIFVKEKYGNYYRNVHGMIEHAHYHLGQIALIKKLVQQ